jgi:hypothetical protein
MYASLDYLEKELKMSTQGKKSQPMDRIGLIIRTMQAVVRANPNRWSEEMRLNFGQNPEEKDDKK